jgi:hypothetical protein
MQLLRLEQLHFGGAGRWFDTNRFPRGSRSSDKKPVFGFLLRIPSRVVRARLLRKNILYR